jgi:hypothetical protein
MTQIWLILVMAAHMAAAWQPFDAQFVRAMTGREVVICLDGQTVERSFAGKMGFQDNNGTWLSVCADVRSPVSAGQVCTMQPANSAKVGGNIAIAGSIVARCFKDAQTPDQCAGLQIAVWKVIEDGPNFPDFSSGSLQVRATPSVISWAQRYFQIGLAKQSGQTGQSGPGGQSGNSSQGDSSIFLAAGGGGGQSQLAPTP